ncbi:kinase-like protein [Mycena alexandri]|uniref:non-specific serine/threonine protein kinase n=1 Tax=Mycena alexandri TaxID=1745969 RepID=A0AAD6X401_9AGAR|nr:kinase-like protein [Mycena alexandri]
MLRAAFRQPHLIARTCARFHHMSTSAEPTNQRLSVDPEGRTVVDLTFASEALGMPAAQGYGWAQFEFGDSVGNDQRYTILRKLGWGMHSSTWLARDEVGNGFVAVKALTGHMTEMNEKAVSWEAEALRLLSAGPPSPHCVRLLDEFIIPGRGSAGSHLCFVLPIYGGDVKALSNSRKTTFDLPTAKRIMLHLLRGIAHAHSRGVVHTDIKHDNIFFATDLETTDIERWIKEDPSRRHPPEMSQDGIVQAAVSQPLPMISDELASRATYVLSDFGCALPSQLHDDRPITTLPLRAPESFLGGQWDTPADIWSFGCLVFELAVSRSLFEYRVNEKYSLTEVENMLYQMILLTGEESFRAAQLSVCPLAGDYFNAACQLKKEPTVFQWPLEDIIGRHGKAIPSTDVSAMAKLMHRCLRLSPEDRATAEELLQDPWLEGASD